MSACKSWGPIRCCGVYGEEGLWKVPRGKGRVVGGGVWASGVSPLWWVRGQRGMCKLWVWGGGGCKMCVVKDSPAQVVVVNTNHHHHHHHQQKGKFRPARGSR